MTPARCLTQSACDRVAVRGMEALDLAGVAHHDPPGRVSARAEAAFDAAAGQRLRCHKYTNQRMIAPAKASSGLRLSTIACASDLVGVVSEAH